MSRLVESNLVFTFPAEWTVRKYDDTAAYQSLSGHGLKGVDFIALAPNDQLWLIEVKNYRPRISPRNGREYRADRKPPEQLVRQIAGKFTDSQRLIRIVCAYFRRRWWRRLLVWYRRRRPRTASNYWFWSEAERRLNDPQRVRFVLWMETPERKTGYDDVVEQLLTAALPELHITVAEASRPHALPFFAAPEIG